MKAKPVVLITGCSSGIGYALAEEFHARGCITYATARKPETLEALAAQGIHTLALDVTDAASIAAAVSAVEAQHGAVDVLVNNAGIPVMGPTAELPLDELRRQWETNLTAPMAMVQAVVPAMAAARAAAGIVNVRAVFPACSPRPSPDLIAPARRRCTASNDALRMELKPFGIEVLLVQPRRHPVRFRRRRPGANRAAHLAALRQSLPTASSSGRVFPRRSTPPRPRYSPRHSVREVLASSSAGR